MNCNFWVSQNIKPTTLLCCLCRTLEPNYRAVWKSYACQQNWQGKKKSTFLHIHRRIKYLGRKSSLLQMDTYRTKTGNFCAALLVTSTVRIHAVADLKSSLESLCHWKRPGMLHRIVGFEGCRCGSHPKMSRQVSMEFSSTWFWGLVSKP